MRSNRAMHSVDGWHLLRTCVALILIFFNGVFIFLIQILVLAACLQKTGGFARYWPLARAKFASV
jgi:hypothetical protein